MHNTLKPRIIGYIGSLILTLSAFVIIIRFEQLHLGKITAIAIILILALLQFMVQCICFINLWSERGTRWNLIVFVSTLSIIFIIVFFSLWIMHHLDCHMMCQHHH